MTGVNVIYDHPGHGLIAAVPDRTGSADWYAQVAASGQLIGFVVDERADDSGEPSEVAPADEDSRPYAAFGPGQLTPYITCAHSLRGALAAIGNNYK
jgi:hypothetical protein